jgi:hypothetical protein
MASEIKVDTISEKTSAGGVTIDGVNIKDSALVTAGSVPLTTIDIDGGTDINAAIVDADLFIIDDGAGGTNRKVAASRIKTYAGGSITALNNATANELVTIGSTTTELDAEANLTFSGSALQCTATLTVGVDDTGHDVKFFGATASSHMLWDESANALNLVASTLGVGTVGTKDLGTGIHVKTADSSASVATAADELVLENGTSGAGCGISILSATDAEGVINFGDSGDADIGRIVYNHSNNYMYFTAGANEGLRIDSAGHVTMPDQPCFCAAIGTSDDAVDSNDYTVQFSEERFDLNADYNVSTYTFTAPVTGKYMMSAIFGHQDASDDYILVYLVSSNKTYQVIQETGSNDQSNVNYKSFMSVIDMDASDTVYLKVNSHSDTSWAIRANEGFFSGYLVA